MVQPQQDEKEAHIHSWPSQIQTENDRMKMLEQHTTVRSVSVAANVLTMGEPVSNRISTRELNEIDA